MPAVTVPPVSALPLPSPCLSFWQQTTRSCPLLHERTTDVLPENAEVVIVGSGITGALTAYELLKADNPPKSLVILEAREAVSGASGRNAGHCRPDAYRGYAAYKALHGKEQALKIIANEKLALEKVRMFQETEEADFDFAYGQTFDCIMTKEFYDYATNSYEELVRDGGDVQNIKFHGAEEAQKASLTRIKSCRGAFEWPAGSTHPAKLGQYLLTRSLGLGANLQTHTQAHTVVPTGGFTGNSQLTHTYSIRFAQQHFYSLIQRPKDGVMILGTSRNIPSLAEKTKNELTGSMDDRVVSKEIADHAKEKLQEFFEEWGEEAVGEGLQYGWTGIIAMTKDSVPYIGAVPSSPGQWIAAGFGGHGMARIFTCVPGLVKLIQGGEWDESLPSCFKVTAERLVGEAGSVAVKGQAPL